MAKSKKSKKSKTRKEDVDMVSHFSVTRGLLLFFICSVASVALLFVARLNHVPTTCCAM